MLFEDFKRKVKIKNTVVLRLEKLIRNGYNNEIILNTRNKLNFCSTKTYKSRCKGCGKDFFVGSNKCSNRFCPVCAKKRSLKNIKLLLPAFDRFLQKGCTVHLLTFTVKNNDNFMESLDKLFSAFRYLTNGNKFYARVFNYMFVGGVKSLEVIRGQSDTNTYHAHLHCLVIKNKFTRDFKILEDLWNKSVNYAYGTTGEKLGSIDIRTVKSANSKKNAKQNITDVRAGLVETLKYITKVEDIFKYEDKMLSDFIIYSNGRRYISTFGQLQGLAKAMEKDLQESAKDTIGKICKYCGCSEFEFLEEFTNAVGPLEDFD